MTKPVPRGTIPTPLVPLDWLAAWLAFAQPKGGAPKRKTYKRRKL
jgi:hypothetical protein